VLTATPESPDLVRRRRPWRFCARLKIRHPLSDRHRFPRASLVVREVPAPTRVSATNVTPRRGATRPDLLPPPWRRSPCRIRCPARRPRDELLSVRSRGAAGVSVTTTCVKRCPWAVKSMNSIACVYDVWPDSRCRRGWRNGVGSQRSVVGWNLPGGGHVHRHEGRDESAEPRRFHRRPCSGVLALALSFLTTRPPFMTKRTRCISVTSSERNCRRPRSDPEFPFSMLPPAAPSDSSTSSPPACRRSAAPARRHPPLHEVGELIGADAVRDRRGGAPLPKTIARPRRALS